MGSLPKQPLLRLTEQIERLDPFHRLLIWLIQIGIFAVAGVTAFLLRFEFDIARGHFHHLIYAVPIWCLTKSLIFRLFGLDRGWWRFVSTHDVFRIGLGNVLGSSGSAVLILLLAPRGFPRSIYLLDFLVCFLATTGVRIFTRMTMDFVSEGKPRGPGKRILIYGAGIAGVTLLREIRSNRTLHYTICGFIDDNSHKKSLTIQGTPVLGAGPALPALVSKHNIEEILIALPSATGPEMTAILRRCHDAGVRCRTIPALAEIIEGRGLASQIREVDVEDLLGRSPVRLDDDQISATLHGKVIMVTGAAGSIGSELCRQIARFGPRAIIGYEISETALFHLDREMRAAFPAVLFHPEIGSVQNHRRISDVLDRHEPSLIYHAAAYKHVPMMEMHVVEAVENNVFGTYQVALAAAEHGVGAFVMISSDKAVRPTNIMGTTKRLAELLINSMQNGGTRFVSVRFGNVLGSNGSVIPVFKKQIAAGGPVTVTHPEMRRYFMTIPEASQLVLQASTMGKGGEIFMLDMGQPVKILDLARNLILLSGLRPDEDIKIEFTGVRPGEKLYEELSTLEEETVPTCHEKIKIFTGKGMRAEEMMKCLDVLRDLCSTRDLRHLILEIKETVPDYNPSAHILRQMLIHNPPQVFSHSSSVT